MDPIGKWTPLPPIWSDSTREGPGDSHSGRNGMAFGLMRACRRTGRGLAGIRFGSRPGNVEELEQEVEMFECSVLSLYSLTVVALFDSSIPSSLILRSFNMPCCRMLNFTSMSRPSI